MDVSVAVKLAGQSVYFLIGNLFTLVVGFLFQIYLARHLHADGIGLFGLLEGGVGVFTALLGFGIAQVAVRFIPEHLQKEQYTELHSLVWGSFAVLASAGVAGMILVYLAMPLLVQQWPELSGHRLEVFTAALMIPISMLLFLSVQILRGFYDIRYIVLGSSFLQLIVKVVIAVTLFTLGMTVMGYLWAVVLSMAVALGWMLLGIRKHLSSYPIDVPVPYKIAPGWLNYAKVMYGNNLLGFWMRPLDRFLLGYFVGTGAVGVLMIVKILYGLPAVLLQMLLSIAAPMLSAAHATDRRDEIAHIYHLTTDWLVRISFPLVLFLAVFAGDILIFFGPTFAQDGTLLLQLLLLGQLVNLGCGPLGNVLNMCGLERQKFRATVVTSIVGALIMVLGAYYFGIIGVGIGTASTVLLGNAFSVLIAKRMLGLDWWEVRYKKWWIPMLSSSLIAVTVSVSSTHLDGPWLISMLGVCYLSFHGIYFISGRNADDELIIDAIKQKLSFGKE